MTAPNVFRSHADKGFGQNHTKGEMKSVDAYMHRAAKILGFEDHEAALKHLLDPAKPASRKTGPAA